MIKVLINNEEVIFNKEVTINEETLATSSVILNGVYPKSWEEDRDYVSRFYLPKDYSRCEFYDESELIFAGVVKNTGNISLNPREPKYCSLQVLDFKTLLSEGTTLDFVIANKTVREAIEQVTNAVANYGFVVGNVVLGSADDVIGAYSTLDKSAYDVYQYFAEITQSRWFTRRVDESTVAIDFYDADKLPRADNIEYTEAYWEENNIIDMTYSFSTADYRNKQVITSSETYANIETNEQLISNGYQTEFTTQQKLGVVNSVTVNGENKSIITNDEKDIGLTADFYYTPGETKFTSAETYSAGTEIVINYIAIIQGREIVYNTAEIQRLNNQLGINGTIARYENRNDVLYSKQLQSIAQNYLKYKGKAEITLKIETENSNLFFVGQQVYFNGPSELPDLVGDYMVKKKTTSFYLVNDVMYAFYTFELTNSYNSETAINFFDNQRAKANGNISQGEYVSRNVDVENTANIIFSNLQITELTIDGDNTLEAGLEMPLVG